MSVFMIILIFQYLLFLPVTASASAHSPSEEASFSNPTFIAAMIAILCLSLCAVTGAYMLCFVTPNRNETLRSTSIRSETLPHVASPVLSDMWNIFSPRDVSIRSQFPTDFSSALCFSPSEIPDSDVYGAPPNETEDDEIREEETCSSGFFKSEVLDMIEDLSFVEADPSSNADAPPDVLQFCEDFEAHFDVAWIGSMQVEDCDSRYLEISMSADGSMKRVVNLDRRRCAEVSIAFSVVPRRVDEKWEPLMIYQDFNSSSETELTLLGTELDLETLIIKGSCVVKKRGEVKHGTFRLVRMTLPHCAIEIGITSDRRRSAIIQGVAGLTDREPTFPVGYEFGGSSLSILGSENDISFMVQSPNTSAC